MQSASCDMQWTSTHNDMMITPCNYSGVRWPWGNRQNDVNPAVVPVTLQRNIHAPPASVRRSRKFETTQCTYHPAGTLTNSDWSIRLNVCVCAFHPVFCRKSLRPFVFQTFLIPMERETDDGWPNNAKLQRSRSSLLGTRQAQKFPLSVCFWAPSSRNLFLSVFTVTSASQSRLARLARLVETSQWLSECCKEVMQPGLGSPLCGRKDE